MMSIMSDDDDNDHDVKEGEEPRLMSWRRTHDESLPRPAPGPPGQGGQIVFAEDEALSF